MTCVTPIKTYFSAEPNENGKYLPAFSTHKPQKDNPLNLPCRKCIPCRIAKTRDWSIRSMHEAQLHGDQNSFITLTFDPEHLPHDNSISKSDFQKFIKNLRQRTNINIRYLACGEYGERINPLTGKPQPDRPHYHASLFGYKPDDLELFSTKGGNKLYTSEFLTKLWGKGHVTIGELTPETAAYVAGYTMKKIGGDLAKEHYEWLDLETAEVYDRLPEFQLSSTRPGIGKPWYDKFKTDLHKGFITHNGKKKPIPEYYLRLLAADPIDELPYLAIKEIRRQALDFDDPELQDDRLAVKQKISIKKNKAHTRNRT